MNWYFKSEWVSEYVCVCVRARVYTHARARNLFAKLQKTASLEDGWTSKHFL